jgi:starvation-inducible DNA-binding protein
MLGEKAPGSLKQFLDMTSIKESSDALHGPQIIKELLDGHEAMIRYLREIIDLASKLGDEGTADLLIQRLRAHEKNAWMLRSTQ